MIKLELHIQYRDGFCKYIEWKKQIAKKDIQ